MWIYCYLSNRHLKYLSALKNIIVMVNTQFLFKKKKKKKKIGLGPKGSYVVVRILTAGFSF